MAEPTSFPNGFALTEEHHAICQELSLDPIEELKAWRQYHKARAAEGRPYHCDNWNTAFKGWLKRKGVIIGQEPRTPLPNAPYVNLPFKYKGSVFHRNLAKSHHLDYSAVLEQFRVYHHQAGDRSDHWDETFRVYIVEMARAQTRKIEQQHKDLNGFLHRTYESEAQIDEALSHLVRSHQLSFDGTNYRNHDGYIVARPKVVAPRLSDLVISQLSILDRMTVKLLKEVHGEALYQDTAEFQLIIRRHRHKNYSRQIFEDEEFMRKMEQEKSLGRRAELCQKYIAEQRKILYLDLFLPTNTKNTSNS